MGRESNDSASRGTISSAEAAEAPLAPARVRAHLQFILASPEFEKSQRIGDFLAFIVEESLAGRGDRLKEHTIAQEVFHKDENFDPKISSVVRVEASRLRARLKDFYRQSGEQSDLRIIIPKGGYKAHFKGAVAHSGNEPPGGGTNPGPDPRQETQRSPKPNSERSRSTLAAVVLCVFVGMVMLLLHGQATSPLTGSNTEVSTTANNATSIALHPVETLDATAQSQRLAAAITAEIKTSLTQFRDLTVVARDTSAGHQQEGPGDVGPSDADPSDAAGTQYLLDGALRRDGDGARLTLHLTTAEGGVNIWSESYDLTPEQVQSIDAHHDIATQVAGSIAGPDGAMTRTALQQLAQKEWSDLSHKDCVLQLYAYRAQANPTDHRHLSRCLTQTVRDQPEYSDAWAALAWIYLDQNRYGFNASEDRGQVLERALVSAQKAVAADPANARAHLAQAAVHYHRRDLDAFLAAANRARKLNPNDTDLLADLGMYMAFSGLWETGIRLAKRAKHLNSSHPAWYSLPEIFNAYRLGNFDRAMALARELNAPEWYWTHVVRAMACGRVGDQAGAMMSKDRLKDLNPRFAQNARSEFHRLGIFSPDLIEEFLIGLRQAGMDV